MSSTKQPGRRPVVRVTAFVAVAILSLGIAGAVANASAPDGGDSTPPVQRSLSDYPQNDQGQRFGSSLESRTPSDEPDLILSIGTDGEIGYVLKTDMNPPAPRNPAEAIAQSDAIKRAGTRLIPLYMEDGKTVIGSFRLN